MRSAASQRARQIQKRQDLLSQEQKKAQQLIYGNQRKDRPLPRLESARGNPNQLAEDQLTRLKSKRLAPKHTTSEPTPPPATSTTSPSSLRPKTLKRLKVGKPSTVRRSFSANDLPSDSGSKYLPPNQARQSVIVTLPQPKLVSPRNLSPTRRRRQDVPSLLSSSAQENIEELLAAQQQPANDDHSRRKAPQSPGDDASSDEEKDQVDQDPDASRQSQQSAARPPSRLRTSSTTKRPRRFSLTNFRTSSQQQLHEGETPLFGGGDLESAPDDTSRAFKRISNFHVEVSESLAASDGEDDPYHNKPHIPSIQLDPRNMYICIIGFVVVLIIGLGSALSPSGQLDDDRDQSEAVGATLGRIRERGVVRCGMRVHYGNNNTMSDDLHGFNIEQCRAMALIALGDATMYQAVWIDADNPFELLDNQVVDIITEGTTFTMGRDVMEPNTKTGYTFTTPYFYAGLMIAGSYDYVECVEALEGVDVKCQGLRICAMDGSMHQEILLDILNGVTIIPNDSVESMESKIQSGICNVVAAEPLYLAGTKELFAGRDWKMGTKVLSYVPLSHVTRQDDTQWSMLANLAINAFIIAETQSVPQQLALEMAVNRGITPNSTTGGYGEDDPNGVIFESMLLTLIAEYGDYGGYYDSHIEALIPPGFGLDKIYDRYSSTGLLASYPFGNLNELGAGPVYNGTLEHILKRGYLICGAIPARGPWFATQPGANSINGDGPPDQWSGFDVEFCRGLASSIFDGDDYKIVFVELNNQFEPYSALANEQVDVVAGARVTLQAMYQEPTSGQPFTFSTPYYYDNDSHDAYAFMTRQIDTQWSEYCFWIVMGVIHAEEKRITSNNSTLMPVVNLFGKLFESMFIDSVGSIGNYVELYNNTLENFIPRSGANLLNDGTGPQLFPIPLS